MKKKLIVALILLIVLLLSQNKTNAQTKLFSDIKVSDFGNTNSIGSANTSRNIAVDSKGNIYIVYFSGTGVRLAKSIDRGKSFLPSILIENTLVVDPEININEDDRIYIAWIENSGVYFSYSNDEALNFTKPRLIGNNISGALHMSSYKNNIYIIDQLGEKLFSNTNNGIGDFNELLTGVSMVYSDVLVDQNGVVYLPMDDPRLVLFESIDQGKSLTKTTIDPEGQVFYSSYALSDGPCGTFIFVGGGKIAPSNTIGYKIDVKTGIGTQITLGDNVITDEARTLYADNKGTLIDGYRADNGDLMMSISSDQGNNFETPILIANGESHNIARNKKTNDIVVVYQKNGEIFLSVYNNILKNIEITSDSGLSFCSNKNFNLDFELEGIFNSNTLFTVSLSDSKGDFSNPTEIGTITTNTSGTINCKIPNNIESSTDYRLQIESQENCIQSNIIGLEITNVGITGNFNICLGESSQLNGYGTPIDNNPWTSSDTTVATIDKNGLITSLNAGKTKINYYIKEGCSNEIEVEIFDLPEVNPIVNLNQCDDNTDGFSSFNLNEVEEEIISNSEDYTITFYTSKNLAENKSDAIRNTETYTNKIVSADKIWARVENTNSCFKISEINLNVSTTQIPSNYLKSYYECDDGTNTTDGIATFNFSNVTEDIVTIFPANQELIINYYQNETDALAETNPIIDISNYKNSSAPNQQFIYIRVDSKLDNDCLGLGAHISLNVEKIPEAHPVTINPQCDIDGDGLFSFDTSKIQSTIIGSQKNVSVSYFDENGIELSSPLPNPFLTSSQNITAKIMSLNSLDKDGSCFNETEIEFIVNKIPVANKVNQQEECDDDFDGIVGFDTTSIENNIIGDQTGLIVKYFDENDNPLPSPLPNPFITASQTIKVRLEDPIYEVCFAETTIDFIVREKPIVALKTKDIICITNATKLEIEVENPNLDYTYIWRTEDGEIVGSESNITIFKGGIYTVVATSKYGCNSNEQKINVTESALSTISINDIEVKDDSDNNFIKINTANLGLGDYIFRLLDKDLNVLFDYQTNPLFENLDGGVYLIEAKDLNNCGSITIEVALVTFPNFFTPNGDGVNDYWQIKGIETSFYKSGVITVFNRYGRQITKFTTDDLGWNGTYNGKPINATDYWFQAILINQNNTVTKRTGNFSLIRK
ncbi:T9SS type B sorting domain-containing protein [Polaribacter sp.]|uniref:T9SS type B sorting domain-containing protein n=1 Tax=Polaribacter sp. TaxID=1920175 RepID=UPI003F6D8BD6